MKNGPEEEEYIESLRRAWRKRAGHKQEELEKLRGEALLKATVAAAHLKEKYRVEAVYLYGSLAWGKNFTHCSDIDLLVKGFPAEMNYWRMLVELEGITSPLDISVVLIEEASPGLREKAIREGQLL